MKLAAPVDKLLIRKKLGTLVFLIASMGAFATLGDGGKKRTGKPVRSSSQKVNSKSFSLRTAYNYKGNNIISSAKPAKYIMLNTTVTYQKGNVTYIMPLKKKVLIDKIKIIPEKRIH